MRWRPQIGLLLVIGFCAVATSGATAVKTAAAARAADAKLDHYLRALDSAAARPDRVRVILATRAGARDRVKGALWRAGAAILSEHDIIDAVTAEVPAGRLRGLAESEDVLHASVDAVVVGSLTTATVPTLSENMLKPTLGIDNSTEVGKDVGVAVIDSGIVNHDQLPVATFYDLLSSSTKTVKPLDGYGHGTHVAGMIRAKDDKSDAR